MPEAKERTVVINECIKVVAGEKDMVFALGYETFVNRDKIIERLNELKHK